MVASRSSFNAAALNKLLKKPNASVFLRKCKRHIALSPKALNDVNKAVLAHLNRLVRKFDSEFDAVVLGCRNVNVLTNLGTIVDDSPHIHIDIEAEFYLFKPEKGSILSGVINKKSRDNIGCLVHGIFNASIPIEPEEGIDIDNIILGETLTFRVEVVDFSQTLPYIIGKLIDSQEEAPGEQTFSEGKKRKRSEQHQARKKIKIEIDDLEDNDLTFASSLKLPHSILKKSSSVGVESSPARRISFYGDKFNVTSDSTDEKNAAGDKTKKKKKKKEKENPSLVESLGNETESEVFIQGSEEINNPLTGEQKMKKKKKPQKTAEKLEEITEFSAVEIKSKKKGKKSEHEVSGINLDEEQSNELPSLTKLKKKTKKIALYELEDKTYDFGEAERLGGEVWESPQKKKKNLNSPRQMVKTDEEGSNIADSTNKILSEKQKIKKSKKKDIEPDVHQNDFSVSSKKKQKPNFTNEIEPKKKKSGKGRNEESEQVNMMKGWEVERDPFSTQLSSMEKQQSPAVQLKPTVKKKKSKKTSQEDVEVSDSGVHEHFSFDKKGKFSSVRPKLQGMANSTIITNTDVLKEKQFTSDSNNSFESLSPIRKSDSDEDPSGFVTSTQMERNPKTIKSPLDAKTLSVSPKKLPMVKMSHSDTDSNSDSDTSVDMKDCTVSNVQQVSEISTKKSQTMKPHTANKDLSNQRVNSKIRSREKRQQILLKNREVINATKAPTNFAAPSDTDESSSSIDLQKPTLLASEQKVSGLKVVQREKQKRQFKPAASESSSSDSESEQRYIQKSQLKPGGSDSSSSDSEAHSQEEQARSKPTKVFSPKPVVSKAVQIDEESSDVDTLHGAVNQQKLNLQNKQKLPLSGTKHGTNESDDDDDDDNNNSTDSDLPSFMRKPSTLPPVRTKSEHESVTSHEQSVSKNNVHEKGTESLLRIISGEKLSDPPKPEKQKTKSPKKEPLPAARQSSDSDSSSSDSDLPSDLKTKVQPVVKKQSPISHKQSGSVGNNSPDEELSFHADNKKFLASKKKSTKALKQNKHESQIGGKKHSESETDTDSIIKGLLAKMKNKIMDSSENVSPVISQKEGGKNSKKSSKVKDGVSSVVQSGESKGKKTSNSKRIDSSKGSKKSGVKSGEKFKFKETPKELTNFADQLLKNL